MLDIVFVSPEIAPFRGVSASAQVASALPKALRGLGHKVTVIAPLFSSIDTSARHLARRLVKIEVPAGGQSRNLVLFEGRTSAGVELNFVSEESLFPAAAAIDEESPAAAVRWGAFTRAVVELLARRDTPPDLVHVLGWQCGALPLLLSEHATLKSTPTVYSVNELVPQGRFDRTYLGELGIAPKHFAIDGVEFFGRISTLKAALQFATRVVAPGPSAQALYVADAGGQGLEGVLRARGKSFVGVLDGVDASVWNASTDPHLDARFDANELASHGTAKSKNKAALQTALGLGERDDVPLFLTYLAAHETRALETVEAIVARLAKADVQWVVALEATEAPPSLADAARRYPDRVRVRTGADQAFVHRALGAADALVYAELDDAYPALALAALRYGALPIVRRRGLAADAVVDCDAKLISGTGFTFDGGTPDALLGAVQRAQAAFTSRGQFRAVQVRAMRIDHSWDRTARILERLYRGARPAPAEVTEVAGA